MFASFGIGPIEAVAIVLITIFTIVLPAWLGWKVAAKAGFPGLLGVLVVVPLGNLLFLGVLAFAPWPRFEQDRDQTPPV